MRPRPLHSLAVLLAAVVLAAAPAAAQLPVFKAITLSAGGRNTTVIASPGGAGNDTLELPAVTGRSTLVVADSAGSLRVAPGGAIVFMEPAGGGPAEHATTVGAGDQVQNMRWILPTTMPNTGDVLTAASVADTTVTLAWTAATAGTGSTDTVMTPSYCYTFSEQPITITPGTIAPVLSGHTGSFRTSDIGSQFGAYTLFNPGTYSVNITVSVGTTGGVIQVVSPYAPNGLTAPLMRYAVAAGTTTTISLQVRVVSGFPRSVYISNVGAANIDLVPSAEGGPSASISILKIADA